MTNNIIGSVAEVLAKIGFGNELTSLASLVVRDCEVCGSREHEVIRSTVEGIEGIQIPIPVSGCKECGYVMQNPRPSDAFYHAFYEADYARVRALSPKSKEVQFVDEDGDGSLDGIENQRLRARNLIKYLHGYGIALAEKTSVLDVGCGSGGFLAEFQAIGCKIYGNDPDNTAVRAARKYLGLEITQLCGEDDNYDCKFDLVLIMGSLEHCQDPNTLLKKVRVACNEGAILINEGRSYPLGKSTSFLNFNHQRYLLPKQSMGLLYKHGFEAFHYTDEEICGKATGRLGNGYVFSRFSRNNKRLQGEDLVAEIRKRDWFVRPEDLKFKLDKHDTMLERGEHER